MKVGKNHIKLSYIPLEQGMSFLWLYMGTPISQRFYLWFNHTIYVTWKTRQNSKLVWDELLSLKNWISKLSKFKHEAIEVG